MIKPYDQLRITYWDQHNNPIDITDGTIAIDIQEGIDSWEGDWQQPDYGRFTLITKNTLLDPLINTYAKFRQKITFQGTYTLGTNNEYTSPIFTGYISDINVDYKPNGDSEITIQGTDIIGMFKRILFTQEMLDYLYTTTSSHGPYDFISFFKAMQEYFVENNILFFDTIFESGEQSGGSLGVPFFSYRPATYIPSIGDSFLDILVEYAQTNLDTLSTRPNLSWPFPTVYIRQFYKYNPLYFGLQQEPMSVYGTDRDFDSVNEPYHGYTNIKVAQNFDTIVNQIYINNTSSAYNSVTHKADYTDTRFDPFILDTSVETNGYSELSLDLIMPAAKANTTEFARYTRDIFEETAALKFDVTEIEFDFLKRELYEYYCGQIIRVTHKVNPSITIDKLYKIAGIKHSINEYSWYTTFVLKPSDVQRVYDHQQENNYQNATITTNANSGNTNFSFNASLTNFPSAMIDSVKWTVLSEPYQYELGYLYDTAQSGESFKNNTPRTGTSFNGFTFDNGGIFDLGVYGPGEKVIAAVITDKNGYNFIVTKIIDITAAQVTANFTYVKDQFDGYVFTDASTTDTDTWLWNFGDGTTSNLKNPPVKYWNAPGTYNVSLTADNGITTNTKTVQITITSSLIPVRYIKYEFKGIRTRANNTSPWNKNFVTCFGLIEARNNGGNSLSYNSPTSYVANKGTVVVNGNSHTLPMPNGYPTDSNWAGSGWTANATDIRLLPLVTNNGNTEEFDISFITDLSLIWQQYGTDGLVTSTSHRNSWDNQTQNERFTFNDSWFVPKLWQLNIHYEPINVYVSADGVNYYKVGDQNVYRTSYPATGYTVIWSMDNKVVMPPRFPV